MRALIIPAAALLVAGFVTTPALHAQQVPTAQEIAHSLTRGIRMVPPGGKGPAVMQPPQVSLNVLFDTGSADVTPAAAKALDRLREALAMPDLQNDHFRIEGHTDTVGTPDYNKDLSERRAASVVDYLAEHGIERDRLQAVGLGKHGLLVPTPDQTPDARNRRVLVVNTSKSAG